MGIVKISSWKCCWIKGNSESTVKHLSQGLVQNKGSTQLFLSLSLFLLFFFFLFLYLCSFYLFSCKRVLNVNIETSESLLTHRTSYDPQDLEGRDRVGGTHRFCPHSTCHKSGIWKLITATESGKCRCCALNCVPHKLKCRSPNFQRLRLWLCLEAGPLKRWLS